MRIETLDSQSSAHMNTRTEERAMRQIVRARKDDGGPATARRPAPVRKDNCDSTLYKESMIMYFANEGPERGPFLHRDAQDSPISILERPGAERPVGRAVPT